MMILDLCQGYYTIMNAVVVMHVNSDASFTCGDDKRGKFIKLSFVISREFDIFVNPLIYQVLLVATVNLMARIINPSEKHNSDFSNLLDASSNLLGRSLTVHQHQQQA